MPGILLSFLSSGRVLVFIGSFLLSRWAALACVRERCRAVERRAGGNMQIHFDYGVKC